MAALSRANSRFCFSGPQFQRSSPESETHFQNFGFCGDQSLIFCPYAFQFQLNSKTKVERAEVALCQESSAVCPKTVDTSQLLNGCREGCEKCKALGENCLEKVKRKYGKQIPFYFPCCDGRLVTPDGDKIEVLGKCNEKTRLCEPVFRDGTPCGDDKKTYLGCAYPSTCRYSASPRKNKLEDHSLPHVSRTNSKLTTNNSIQVVDEPKRCFTGPAPCNSHSPLLIHCGAKLPRRYVDYAFCDCPSADLKTGYNCNGEQCEKCKLHGVECSGDSDSECCINHKCTAGKCQQCFPTGLSSNNKRESCADKKNTGDAAPNKTYVKMWATFISALRNQS